MAVTYLRNNEGVFEQVGPGGATTDTTLTQTGKPADAGAVGVALTNYVKKSELNTDGDQFELIKTVTVTDDTTQEIIIETDNDGNSINLKSFYAHFNGMIPQDVTYFCTRINDKTWQEQFSSQTAYNTETLNGTNKAMRISFEILGGGVYRFTEQGIVHLRADGEPTATSGGTQTSITSINKILFRWATSSSYITNGTVVSVYGVRK